MHPENEHNFRDGSKESINPIPILKARPPCCSFPRLAVIPMTIPINREIAETQMVTANACSRSGLLRQISTNAITIQRSGAIFDCLAIASIVPHTRPETTAQAVKARVTKKPLSNTSQYSRTTEKSRDGSSQLRK